MNALLEKTSNGKKLDIQESQMMLVKSCCEYVKYSTYLPYHYNQASNIKNFSGKLTFLGSKPTLLQNQVNRNKKKL